MIGHELDMFPASYHGIVITMDFDAFGNYITVDKIHITSMKTLLFTDSLITKSLPKLGYYIVEKDRVCIRLID